MIPVGSSEVRQGVGLHGRVYLDGDGFRPDTPEARIASGDLSGVAARIAQWKPVTPEGVSWNLFEKPAAPPDYAYEGRMRTNGHKKTGSPVDLLTVMKDGTREYKIGDAKIPTAAYLITIDPSQGNKVTSTSQARDYNRVMSGQGALYKLDGVRVDGTNIVFKDMHGEEQRIDMSWLRPVPIELLG